jgi:hypothetical protein
MRKLLLGLALLTSTAAAAAPTNFSYTGNITQDDDVLLFNFTTNGTSAVTLRSYSYAGGTNAAGQTFGAGGFDPILTLYDSTGTRIDFQDDADSGVPADPTTGRRFDVLFTEVLQIGSYTVALSQYDNFGPTQLDLDEFIRAGESDFTKEYCDTEGDRFCDVSGAGRTGFYAFDLLGVELASGPGGPTDPGDPDDVPEPATLGLLGIGALGLAGARRRRRA